MIDESSAKAAAKEAVNTFMDRLLRGAVQMTSKEWIVSIAHDLLNMGHAKSVVDAPGFKDLLTDMAKAHGSGMSRNISFDAKAATAAAEAATSLLMKDANGTRQNIRIVIGEVIGDLIGLNWNKSLLESPKVRDMLTTMIEAHGAAMGKAMTGEKPHLKGDVTASPDMIAEWNRLNQEMHPPVKVPPKADQGAEEPIMYVGGIPVRKVWINSSNFARQNPTCPNCGSTKVPDWQVPFKASEAIINCDACHLDYTCHREVTVRYKSAPIAKADPNG